MVHKPRPCLVDAESYKNATHSVPFLAGNQLYEL